MDFSKFTISKKYVRGDKEFELFFDFNLTEVTGHNRKTFDDCQSLLHYLQNNSENKIFVTLTQTPDFYEEDNKLVINLRAYQEFCKRIGQNGKNRTQAFLAQKLRRYSDYSEDERKRIIAASTKEEIEASIDPEILQKLQSATAPEVVEKGKFIVIDDQNKKEALRQVLSGGYSEEFWELMSSNDPELTDRLSAGRLQINRRKIIDELKWRLSVGNLPETAGGNAWQPWIYRHNWLFGVNYQKPIEKQKINIGGVMPDYLFPTLDGFADILEIKLPSFEVIEEDSAHPGSWVWSRDSNKAIGQVVNYLGEIDRLRLEIEREIERVYGKKLSLLKPRAFILIGQSDNWSQDKKEGLRKLNHSLHGIEILTYSDLLNRGGSFLELSPI